MTLTLVFSAAIAVFYVSSLLAEQYAPEGSLARVLFDAYPRDLTAGGVPTTDGYHPKVSIFARFSISNAPGIDDLIGMVRVGALLELVWNDPFLAWTPGQLDAQLVSQHPEWKNISTLSIGSDKVWTPNILHVENRKDLNVISVVGQNTPVLIHNGRVEWKVMVIFDSLCPLSLTKFPFDQQQCELTFQIPSRSCQFNSSSHSSGKQGVATSPNDLWQLSNLTSAVAPNRTQFIVTLNLQRHSNYYLWNMIIPLALVAILPTTVYMLPPDEPVRTVFGSNCLLACGFLLVSIAKQIPKTSQNVYFSYYSVSTLVLNAVAVLYSAVVCLDATRMAGYGRSGVKMNTERAKKIRNGDRAAFGVSLFFLIASLVTFKQLTS